MPKASEIAHFLNLTFHGEDVFVENYSQLSNPKPNSIVFAKRYSSDFHERLNSGKEIVAIVSSEYEDKITCCHIVSSNPRLDYIKTLSHFFAPQEPNAFIHPSAVIEEGATIGNHVYIGAGCYISNRSVIGDHCVLHPHVVLDNKVTLGHHCEIKSGAVLGQEGFGFERDENGVPIHFPHFGDVVVGNNVFIGSNSTVERATLGSTIIEDNVKIDDLVQIGHNSKIGAGSMVTVGAIVCGGAELKEQSYLAPNVSVKEKVILGKRSFVGLGAVVLKEVPDDVIVAGNPAKPLIKK